MRVAVVVVALAAACSRAPRGAERGEPGPALEHRGGTVVIDAASAPDAAAPDECVEACVRRRHMEAVSIEHIRATCTALCSVPPPP